MTQSALHLIQVAVAAVLLLLVGFLGGSVVWLIATGKIDLSRLISEPNGDASMSRFQLLIFTFVVALSLFAVVVGKGDFPDVPGSVLALVGISAGSYLVSKGIQFSSADGTSDRAPMVTVTPTSVKVAAGGTQQFAAKVDGADDTSVTWSLLPSVPAAGRIDQNGLYTAPAALAQASTHIQVVAVSNDDANGQGTAHIELA